MSDRVQQPPEQPSRDTRDDATQVEWLRARVAELESQLEERAELPSEVAAAGGRRTAKPRRERWRTITATTLVVVACLLAPLAVVSTWASRQISDTDRYVETVSPLASNPDVQAAVTDEISTAIFGYIDVSKLTRQALNALSQQGLSPETASQLQGLSVPLASAVQNFIRNQVANIVASPAFATAWDSANRVAHEQMVSLLSGEQGGAISAQNDTVTINLGPFIARAKQQLEAQGFAAASNIPTVNKSFPLVQSSEVTKLQRGYRLLNNLGTWLPWIALALLGLGIYVAKSHRRAIIAGGLGVVAAMLVLGAGITVARALYLNAVPDDTLPRDAAAAVYDTLVRFLRDGLRATGLAFALLAGGAFLTGKSVTAVRTRAALVRGIDRLRGGAETAGLRTGRLGPWVNAHKRALRIAAVVAGMLALTFWPNATVTAVIVVAVLVLLAVGVIEFLGRPAEAGSTTGGAGGAAEETPGAVTPEPSVAGEASETATTARVPKQHPPGERGATEEGKSDLPVS